MVTAEQDVRLEFLGLGGVEITALAPYSGKENELSLAVGTKGKHIWYNTCQNAKVLHLPYPSEHSPVVNELKVVPRVTPNGHCPQIFMADPLRGVANIILECAPNETTPPRWNFLGLEEYRVKNIVVESDKGIVTEDEIPWIIFATGASGTGSLDPSWLFYRGTCRDFPLTKWSEVENIRNWSLVLGPYRGGGNIIPRYLSIQTIAVEWLSESRYRIYLGTKGGVYTYGFNLEDPQHPLSPYGSTFWRRLKDENGVCPENVVAMKFLPAGERTTFSTLWVATETKLYVKYGTSPWQEVPLSPPCKCNPSYTSLDVKPAADVNGLNFFRFCLGRTAVHGHSAVYGMIKLPIDSNTPCWWPSVPLNKDVLSVVINSPVSEGTLFELYLGTKDGLYRYIKKETHAISEVVERKADRLAQFYSNPFNRKYPTPINGKCKIYNILGQLVQEIENSNWDGKDMQGRETPAGIYFYELGNRSVRRIVVLK
jgi:hypothetical protein